MYTRSLTSDLWDTPAHVFTKYGKPHNLNLDVCATSDHTMCARFFSPCENGLTQEWNGRVWMNPPFSNVKAWVAKAYRSRNVCECIICLLPARTDTVWFHSFVYRKASLQFIKGRISFTHFSGTSGRASFASMIASYRPDTLRVKLQETLEFNLPDTIDTIQGSLNV